MRVRRTFEKSQKQGEYLAHLFEKGELLQFVYEMVNLYNSSDDTSIMDTMYTFKSSLKEPKLNKEFLQTELAKFIDELYDKEI